LGEKVQKWVNFATKATALAIKPCLEVPEALVQLHVQQLLAAGGPKKKALPKLTTNRWVRTVHPGTGIDNSA
jgi:hypothetical protein